MSDSPLSEFARGLAEDTRAHVKQAIAQPIAPLQQRIREQDAEIADLKERRGLKYCGVWRSDEHYGPGDVVSHKGMWTCLVTTRGRPGESRDWQLAVAQGKDGRDFR